MVLSALNVFFITIGILTLGYSMQKATHERKYWRLQKGYYLHLTLDVVLCFLIGLFIFAFNLVCILRDYWNAKENVEQRNSSVNILADDDETNSVMGTESQC